MNHQRIRKARKTSSRRRLSDIPSCIPPHILGPDCRNIPALPSPSTSVNTMCLSKSDDTEQCIGNTADNDHSPAPTAEFDLDSTIAAPFADDHGDSSESLIRMLSPQLDQVPVSIAKSLLSRDMTNECGDDQGAAMSPDITLKAPSWRVMWALLMTNGSKRFKKDTYQSVRTFF